MMRIANEVTMSAPVRLGFGMAIALVALVGAALAIRPEMMGMGMRMVRGLVVGFGL